MRGYFKEAGKEWQKQNPERHIMGNEKKEQTVNKNKIFEIELGK